MAFIPTQEQREAIENEGGRLLVSAAAGSGKTKVLVERLLRHVDAGEDVDRFLVITFTNAAAAELRERVMDALFDRVAADPANLRLRAQAGLLNRAHIGTIHSFCSSVIRENAHTLRLPPDFRVADEKEARILKETTLSDLLDELYAEDDPEFNALADIMGAGRDDSGLVKVILDTHMKLLSHPSPEKWVERQLKALELEGVADAAETIWGRDLMDGTLVSVRWWIKTFGDILASCGGDAKFMRGYGNSMRETLAGLTKLEKALQRSWDETREAISGIQFPRASAAPGFEREIALRNACKCFVQKLPDLYWDDSEKAIGDMKTMAPVMRSLLRTVLRFDKEFGDVKRKRGVLDFSDQEHMALRLLADPETGAPTAVARELSERFSEIMVDEYQDVNEIQETIFNAVSREGRNIFTVGDVKQSVYRFRLADPTIFLRCYETFKDAGKAGDGEPRKVTLSRNFRSKPAILEGVNFVFENLMSRGLGELDYGPKERLYPPEGEEPDGEMRVELNLLGVRKPEITGTRAKKSAPEPSTSDEGEEAADRQTAEALFAARRIKEMVGRETVTDGNGVRRPLTYGDIAILMRSPRPVQAKWEQVVAAEGVPLSAVQPTSFFGEQEVSLALSMLSVIDNPRQDIPLITVLRCPVYGFTADELANIRLFDKTGDFWSALTKAAEKTEKCKKFVDELNELRTLAPDMTADVLLWAVYTKTRLFAVVSAMPSGQERRENLMLLLETARKSEEAGYRGLFGFMTWVRMLQARGDGLETEPRNTENRVTLMSTHKSKGLEFPVVILAGLTRRFNNEDARARLVIHPDLGPGPKLTDLTRRLEYNTIARRAVNERLRREMLSEELRILYVAMTRPKERLILLCSYTNAYVGVKRSANLPLPVPAELLLPMQSPAEWLLAAALRRPECDRVRFGLPNEPCAVKGAPWRVELIEPDWFGDGEKPQEKESGEETPPQPPSPELAARLEYVYPYMGAAAMPSKVTATELKGSESTASAVEEARSLIGTAEEEPEKAPAAPSFKPAARTYEPPAPSFMEGCGGLTPAQKGVAAHMVMQYADYKKCLTTQGVKDEIDRLYKNAILTREQALAVRPENISRFFTTMPGKLILSAEKLYRELKFSLLVDSEEIPGFAAGEKVLMQGVADCCVEKNGRLTVIDFKTDHVTDANIKERDAYYAGQLEAYAVALRRIFGLPVERKILCYLTAGKFTVLP